MNYKNSDNDRQDEQQQHKRVKIHESFLVIDSAFATSTIRENEWVLDGGTTKHFTGNKELLYDVRKQQRPSITVTANGYSEYDLVGDALINVNGKNIQLKDVAYVPGFNANLISVAKIVDTEATVTYNRNNAIITQNGQVKLVIPRRQDLYILPSSTLISSSNINSTQPKSS
jgi:hypothetical protein